ncbi:MAG: hypothetical protein WAJ96_20650 [Candidatus Acidiferrum sp.]
MTYAWSARLLVQSLAFAMTFALAFPANAYDVPMSESSIRDAYFLGSRTGGLNLEFVSRYALSIPELKQGNCTSDVRVETPFLQIAKYSSAVPNYSAQDAVQEFHGKHLTFRLFLDICYETDAPPNSVKFKIIQHKKILDPLSATSTPYAEPVEDGYLSPNGEQIALEFTASRIDSSDLTIVIDKPDGQHAETVFDLQSIR